TVNTGSGNDTLIGGTGADTFNAGAGNDTLDGGSSGADRLTGGAGDDLYIVSHTGMTLTEAARGGTDTVQSSITFTLAANFENVALTGAAAINGTGNASDNVITGNSGANTLNGAGGNDTFKATIGDGNDSMIGGAGTDTYDLSATTAGANVNLSAGTSS